MKYLKTYESFNDNSLVLYHGSNTDFDEFDIRYFNFGSGDGGWLGKGFYFTNELFDSSPEVSINKIERTESTNYYTHNIYITIKGYEYRFVIQLKEGYLYFDYYIVDWRKYNNGKINKNDFSHGFDVKTFTKYDFVINDSMFISVLNSIPIVLDAFIKEAIKDNLSDTKIKGIYYDADERRRERIYEYFFKSKLPQSTYEKVSGYFFFTLKEPVILKDFKLSY